MYSIFDESGIRNRLFILVTNLAVFSYLVLYALVPNGYAYGPALVLICALISFSFSESRVKLNLDDWKIFSVLFLMFFIGLFLIPFHGFDASEIDRASRFFLAALCLIFVVRYPVAVIVFWCAVVLGAILHGGYALIQVTLHDLGLDPVFYENPFYGNYNARVRTSANAIYFGNSSLILGLFCLAGLKWGFHQSRSRLWVALFLLGFVFGLIGSILSGTRSGWVTVPFAFLVLLRIYKEHLSIKRLVIFLGVGLVAAALVLMTPQTRVYDRIYSIYSDVNSYASGGSRTTSIGQRFEMWRSGLLAFKEAPLVGLGREGYDNFEAGLIERGEIVSIISRWRHLHNQYIDTMAKQGLVGLLALLVVLFVPLRLFYSRSSSDDPVIRSLAAAGMIFMIAYIDINLTQSLFARNIGIMKFAFMVIFIWGMISALERKQKHKESKVIES